MKYKILFWRETWYNATIEAESEEEAREKFNDGQYRHEEPSETQPDYWNERIMEIEEIDE